jgi:hypothetical protein
MLFLSVRGFLDYAGPSNPLVINVVAVWPSSNRNGVGILFQTDFSKLNSPAHRYLCLRFKWHLAMSPARLEARMDSLLSFPVGLFIPYNMPVYPGALRVADNPPKERFNGTWGQTNLLYFADGAAFWKEVAVARIPSA